METRIKTKPAFKLTGAILLVIGLFVTLSAGKMSPIVFAMSSLATLSSFAFLLYTLNKDLENGLPSVIRIIGLLLLGFGTIVLANETLLGFAVENYLYWTMPPVEAVSNWIGFAMAGIIILIVGGAVLFRDKLGDWFYE